MKAPDEASPVEADLFTFSDTRTNNLICSWQLFGYKKRKKNQLAASEAERTEPARGDKCLGEGERVDRGVGVAWHALQQRAYRR